MELTKIIETAEARCTGCLRCMLACSFFTSGRHEFNPSLSKIRVGPGSVDGEFEIAFEEGCNACGICTQHCAFGALNIRGDKADG